jgi:AcrR family transcriptional regulator
VAKRNESRAQELDAARRLGKAARPSREAAQRALLLGAMTRAAGEHGYEACRVEDVLERSGLSRASFYLHFTNKTGCFMAAFGAAVDGLLATVVEAVEAAPDREARVEAGINALIGRLTANPAMARLALVEIRTAGPEGQERYQAACKRFARLLAGGGCLRPVRPGLEMETAERAVEAVATVLWMEVGAGRTESLPRLVPALVAAFMRMMSAADRESGAR